MTNRVRPVRLASNVTEHCRKITGFWEHGVPLSAFRLYHCSHAYAPRPCAFLLPMEEWIVVECGLVEELE